MRVLRVHAVKVEQNDLPIVRRGYLILLLRIFLKREDIFCRNLSAHACEFDATGAHAHTSFTLGDRIWFIHPCENNSWGVVI